MDRKRTVLAATAASFFLVAGSTAFALANGIFVTQPVDRVGSFQAIEARLVPETKTMPKSTISAPPPDETPTGGAGSAGAVLPNSSQSGESSTTSLNGATGVPATEPTTEPSNDSSHESAHEPDEPSSSSTSTPTSAPQVNAPSTTTTIAHSAPSTVPEPGDDSPTTPGSHSDD